STDAPRLDPSRWEAAIFSEAPIVWAQTNLYKTGVVPYVNEELGARVPSLRRLFKKGPYFTNGSARTLREVLENFREEEGDLVHAQRSVPSTSRFSPLREDEQRAVLAFLDLL